MKSRAHSRRRLWRAIGGYALFIIVIAAVVAAALVVWLIAGRDLSKWALAAILFGLIAFLSVAFAVYDILRRKVFVEKPVKKILDATGRIASGDFSVRLEPAHIYAKFNMYDEIMENLNRMSEELSRTEVLRSDFIANVSHEIKTPLAVIQNYAAALEDERLPEEIRRECAATISSAAKKLSEVIANILKLNKLENQKIFPDVRRMELGEDFRECVLGFEEIIEEKRLDLECDIDDVSIVADPGFLDIIWNNLLSNAIKFTPEGGKIFVSLKDDGDRAVIKVSDTGCGMNAETGAHIFDKFYQGDTSHAQEGNGLGLALVKKVIDLIGGEISVESEPGKGSTFIVRIRKGEE